MKNSLFEKYTLIFKLTLKNYSPLRIFQILEASQLKIEGRFLDLGSSESPHNISNYINNDLGRIYANKINNNNNNKNLEIDLEDYPNKINQKFDNILLMNVLEHIKNYHICFKNIKDLLKDNGVLYGSTPFIFNIHPSPNDYFRYTKQFLEEYISQNGFNDIKVKVLGTGIFCCIYALIFNFTKKIPLLNIIIFPIVLFLDKIINLFSKNAKDNNPLGYFFIAKKTN